MAATMKMVLTTMTVRCDCMRLHVTMLWFSDKNAADLEDLMARPEDLEGVDLGMTEEAMQLQQEQQEAADEKAQKEVEAMIRGERYAALHIWFWTE